MTLAKHLRAFPLLSLSGQRLCSSVFRSSLAQPFDEMPFLDGSYHCSSTALLFDAVQFRDTAYLCFSLPLRGFSHQCNSPAILLMSFPLPCCTFRCHSMPQLRAVPLPRSTSGAASRHSRKDQPSQMAVWLHMVSHHQCTRLRRHHCIGHSIRSPECCGLKMTPAHAPRCPGAAPLPESNLLQS